MNTPARVGLRGEGDGMPGISLEHAKRGNHWPFCAKSPSEEKIDRGGTAGDFFGVQEARTMNVKRNCEKIQLSSVVGERK